MSRNKTITKNKPVSISLEERQITFLKKHKEFNLSKFIRMFIDDYLELFERIEKIKRR